jgi:hypothetical protein
MTHHARGVGLAHMESLNMKVNPSVKKIRGVG